MVYDKNRAGQFKIFDKVEMKFLDQTWESNDFLMAHHINSYEKPENPDIVCLDVIESNNDYVNDRHHNSQTVQRKPICLSINSYVASL